MVAVLGYEPNVTVDDGVSPSTIEHPPDQNGGTVLQTVEGTDLNSNIEIQGPVPQTNPWQEFNLFIGAMSATFQTTPGAMVVLVEQMCQAWREQTYWAGGSPGLGAAARPIVT